jgi:copper chaperone
MIDLKAISQEQISPIFTTMTITLKVPSMVCEVCAKTITTAIKNHEPTAEVTVELANKTVIVETQASANQIKNAIISAGHTVDD